MNTFNSARSRPGQLIGYHHTTIAEISERVKIILIVKRSEEKVEQTLKNISE